MQVLSIFVDESGDFGEYAKHAPYYIVTMVFHDQSIDISPNIKRLDEALLHIGYGSGQAVHTEPLIRREKPYQFFQPNERRSIFSKLYYFTLGCEIRYKSFIFHKIEFENNLKMETRMARDMSFFIRDNLSFFQKYDKIILYYDNGQNELSKILKIVFSSYLSNFEMRRVLPSEYRLFQVADLICTLELLREKVECGKLSNSEEKLFHSKRELKKDFLKGIKKKEW